MYVCAATIISSDNFTVTVSSKQIMYKICSSHTYTHTQKKEILFLEIHCIIGGDKNTQKFRATREGSGHRNLKLLYAGRSHTSETVVKENGRIRKKKDLSPTTVQSFIFSQRSRWSTSRRLSTSTRTLPPCWPLDR